MFGSFILRLLKYIAIALAIYLICRYVPKKSMSCSEIVLISLISIFVFILFETMSGFYDSSLQMSDNQQKIMCSSVCSSKEPMDNVIPDKISAPVETQTPAVTPLADRTEEEVKKEIYDYANIVKKMDESNSGVQPPVDQETFNKVMKYLTDKGISANDMGTDKGVLNDELKYSTADHNHLCMPDNYDKKTFEYGYSFLPPEKWYPQPPVPPVCVAERRANVCPMLTTGAPVDMKEWNDSRRITPPDQINTQFVMDKLNSGR